MEIPSDTVIRRKDHCLCPVILHCGPPAQPRQLVDMPYCTASDCSMWTLNGRFCGLLMSRLSAKPTACNMARAGACLMPSTTRLE